MEDSVGWGSGLSKGGHLQDWQERAVVGSGAMPQTRKWESQSHTTVVAQQARAASMATPRPSRQSGGTGTPTSTLQSLSWRWEGDG